MTIYPLADHFAEKLHAYTRPRERKTRVKDLLDLSLVLEELADELPPAAEMRRTIQRQSQFLNHSVVDANRNRA